MELNNAIIIKSFSHEIDAEVAAAYLESQGIETLVKKDDCGGNYPQLQVSSGVHLLINPADEQAARSILDEVDSRQSSNQIAEPLKPKKRATILAIGFLLVGVWAGYFIATKAQQLRATSEESKETIVEDTNGDGKPDIFYYYNNKKLASAESDRNYDGIIDAWYHYKNGRIVSSEHDDNFDGKPHTWVKYLNDNNYETEIDTDFNGISDATVYYANQLPTRQDWHPNGAAIIVKKEVYEHGNKRQEFVDLDKDGTFDIRVDYDSVGNAIKKIQLPKEASNK